MKSRLNRVRPDGTHCLSLRLSLALTPPVEMSLSRPRCTAAALNSVISFSYSEGGLDPEFGSGKGRVRFPTTGNGPMKRLVSEMCDDPPSPIEGPV